jgi:hypothetical protein
MLGKLLLFAMLVGTVQCQSAYRYGSLSWTKVTDPSLPPNTVDFELVTGWRYNFNWVYVTLVNGRTVTDTALRPLIGDVVRITGLTFADASGQSTQAGTSEIVFQSGEITTRFVLVDIVVNLLICACAGDGDKYFVDVTITAYSVTENWLMGITKIRHTYKSPFLTRGANIYPQGYS